MAFYFHRTLRTQAPWCLRPSCMMKMQAQTNCLMFDSLIKRVDDPPENFHYKMGKDGMGVTTSTKYHVIICTIFDGAHDSSTSRKAPFFFNDDLSILRKRFQDAEDCQPPKWGQHRHLRGEKGWKRWLKHAEATFKPSSFQVMDQNCTLRILARVNPCESTGTTNPFWRSAAQ